MLFSSIACTHSSLCEKLWKEWRLIGTEFDDKIDHCRLHLVEAERRMNSFQPRTKRFDDDIQVIHWSSIYLYLSFNSDQNTMKIEDLLPRSNYSPLSSHHTIRIKSWKQVIIMCCSPANELDLITGHPSTALCVREFQNCQKQFFFSFQ